MKEKKLVIKINKPVSEVFAFTINPKNTPLWVASIAEEETSEWPIKNGTIYKNRGGDGKWSEYLISEFEANKRFVFSKKDSDYHVRYIFSEVVPNTTQIEYHEWVDNGELEVPFTIEELNELKAALEK